jgi:hypothetical protein
MVRLNYSRDDFSVSRARVVRLKKFSLQGLSVTILACRVTILACRVTILACRATILACRMNLNVF